MPTSQPFRLLDLPREVRDTIYNAALCDWPVQGPFHHSLAETPRRKIQLESMARKIEPNLLLANKMIYQEAKQIFLKGNQFVHLKMTAKNPTLISGAFVRSQVPVVATGHDKVALFRDLVVMKHLINFPEDPSSAQEFRMDIILLHKDLSRFCVGLALVDIHSRRFAGQSRHSITILNPFAKTLSPDFLNITNQERLLKPYGQALRGFDHVEIKGSVDRDLAKDMTITMNREPTLPSTDRLLEKLHSRKGLGDQAALDSDPLTALAHWNATNIILYAARNRRAWTGFKESAGKDFRDQISGLAFQVQSSRIQTYLQVAHRDLKSNESECVLKAWTAQIFTACCDAMRVGKILGTDWRASNDQLATVLYCWAQGHRIAEGDVHFAEDAIYHADQLRPHDPEIRSEMEKILEWKANVGLP